MRPMRSGHGRPKSAGGVQSRAGKRSGDQDAERNREANAKAGDRLKCAFFVDRGGKDGEDEEESGYSFKSDAGPNRKIASEFRCAQSNGTPGFIANDSLQQKGGGSSAGKLRCPIENGIHGVHAFGDPEADGHRGIEVSAGDVTERPDHNADGQTMGEGDAKETQAGAGVQVWL